MDMILILPALAGFFLLGVPFYLYRFIARAYVTSVNGYFDRENEFWHAVCLAGMTACLAPTWFNIPDTIWIWMFPVGVLWYLVRAFTWGKTVPYNKQWYDFAHAAMLFGMWWMFAMPLAHPVITIGFTAYWLWFGSYYAYRIANDFKKPHWLTFGQDIAHFAMALVMALMTVWPGIWMPQHAQHQHQHEMPGMPGMQDGPICSPSQQGDKNPQPDHMHHHH